MRPAIKFGRRAGQPRRWQHLLLAASGLAIALRYCRMAQRDEENGFPCTAALEWRKAAELCAPFDRVAGHCWQQWERIMHLPRRLAAPLGPAVPAVPVIPSAEAAPRAAQRCRLVKPAAMAFSYLRRRRAGTLA